MQNRIERALISVSDKAGIVPFAAALAKRGVQILSTGGTHKTLVDAGVAAREISEHTGFPEIMHGRVKTLHPRVHGGILALRDEGSHQAAMAEHDIAGIDLVVVNLYPFESTVAREGVTRAEAIEQIDIGGPSMVRSAAKNHRFVGVVTDPADYETVLAELEAGDGCLSEGLLRRLALKAFQLTARYDAMIGQWLSRQEPAGSEDESPFPETHVEIGRKAFDLRYGENPHQRAAFYRSGASKEPSVASAEVLSGKPLSYNNLIDLDAALGLAKEFDEPFVAVTKHNNPCGAACAATVAQALADAWAGDPLSAFGSVLSFNRSVDLAAAEFLVSENRFVEAIVAPGFDQDAFEVLTTRPKWGKNVRLLACGDLGPSLRDATTFATRHVDGGFLVQDRDLASESDDDSKVVTRAQPTPEQRAALHFAARVSKHVKSNAIVIAKGTRVLGVGAGQMSRVDSVNLAVQKSGDEVSGSVMASDAFFPFPDGVEAAMRAGVGAVLQPGGSRRDEEVIAACDAGRVPMIFTGCRHFRH